MHEGLWDSEQQELQLQHSETSLASLNIMQITTGSHVVLTQTKEIIPLPVLYFVHLHFTAYVYLCLDDMDE